MSSNDNLSNCEKETIKQLDDRRGKIVSRTGGWFPGRGVFSHGYSMLDELVGKKSYFQILILNASGRLVSRKLADWVESIYGCLSWPDPRIWCNQIGALSGSARTSSVSATAMGILATDSRAYGVLPLIEGVAFIQGAVEKYRAGMSPEEIVQSETSARGGKPFIVGYIRPIARGDERLEVMERVSKDLGIEEGEHLSLAYKIERVLLDNYGEGMNINGYVSAVLSDEGFSGKETYQIFSTVVASGVTACYLDAYAQPAESFLPLRCEDVSYQGVPERPVPKAGHD